MRRHNSSIMFGISNEKQNAIRMLTKEIAEYEKMYIIFKDRFPIMARNISKQKDAAYQKITKIMSN